MAKAKKSTTKKKKTTTKSTKTARKKKKLIDCSSQEMLQPGGRGGIFSDGSGIPGHRGR